MIALGSSSTTRAQILHEAGVEFVKREVEFDEESVSTSLSPTEYIYTIARGKERAYLSRHILDMPFLVADTVVCAGERMMGKAVNIDEAREMLRLQSGSQIRIITCMIYKCERFELTDISQTVYEFEKFDEAAMEEYLAGGEWRGKAGAVMVEGFCKPYIKSVRGYESTAMGLCLEKLLAFAGV
jgi:septum formation protein